MQNKFNLIASLSLLAQFTSAAQAVVPSLWDGHCTYPIADSQNFNLTAYLGRWYQVAGTYAPFTAGCTCIYAEYGLGANGTVSVMNACQRGGRSSTIMGVATPSDQSYGKSGVFQVSFPIIPGGGANGCKGPNYIVQDYSYDGKWALVQASNFSTLFVLSREQNPGSAAIDAWLERAEKRGTNLSNVIHVNQTGCVAV